VSSIFFSRVVGWLSLLLLGIVIGLPYLRGRAKVVPVLRKPMFFHYWFAPLVLAGSFVHAWIPMASHSMPKTNLVGLWIATVALGVIALQIFLGVALRSHPSRAWLRRTHWLVMLGVTALVLIHLWMNNQALRGAS